MNNKLKFKIFRNFKIIEIIVELMFLKYKTFL